MKDFEGEKDNFKIKMIFDGPVELLKRKGGIHGVRVIYRSSVL